MQLSKLETPISASQNADTATIGTPARIITDGRAEVTFCQGSGPAHQGGHAALDHLYYRDPMKILFPRPVAGDLTTAVLVTTSGGMVGGDKLAFAGKVEAGASALFTAQAAEKVYRSVGPDCEMSVDLMVEDGGWLEWLPHESILFDQARLKRKTTISASGTGRVLAGEMMVFGRLARGEVFKAGLARDAWDVSIDGRPVWRDALHLEGDVLRILDHAAAFDGARANATAILVGHGVEDHLDDARACLEQASAGLARDDVLCGATAMKGIVIARFMAREPMKLRRVYGAWWKQFRHKTRGLPERLPRLWEI
ncbi:MULTISPECIES: urease accessory protein UreD [Thalassospira]|uniref:Urease accessory protein UreD n=2 Tax=Thalassospira TaxID=168934 RepID=A0A367WCF6_9PROT|nr:MULTISPECIES: urease accessory protein UreD [Thalassospira]MDG4717385.1 urease accessory protein UreD [Thalassospira sp. FZY0004]RCK39136.1 urease accessory protein UreD [Thalassospira profundimaris]